MSILIKGMEMPIKKNGTVIIVYPDGQAFTSDEKLQAVELPPHGDLIDADALRQDWLENGENDYVYDTNSFLYSLDDAPTIIPADKDNNVLCKKEDE